ncbi:MAG: hypothetical protein ACFFG0_03165 [Candidatus Thorarchaeota archaeon]
MSDITFSKGSHSVDIECGSVSEEYKNKLITLPIPQSATNQSSGKKDTKIVDLLRITHQFVIKAYICATSTLTAKQVKDKLKLIANGAETNGGVVSMVYDGDTLYGYIESLAFTKKAMDSPTTESQEEVKYEAAITFVVGVSV